MKKEEEKEDNHTFSNQNKKTIAKITSYFLLQAYNEKNKKKQPSLIGGSQTVE